MYDMCGKIYAFSSLFYKSSSTAFICFFVVLNVKVATLFTSDKVFSITI